MLKAVYNFKAGKALKNRRNAVVETTLEAKSSAPNDTIILLMGEHHTVAGSIIAEIAIIDQLLKAGLTIQVGMEQPHKHYILKTITKSLTDPCTLTREEAVAFTTRMNSPKAPLSTFARSHYFASHPQLERNLSLELNDLASKETTLEGIGTRVIIDTQDPITQEFIAKQKTILQKLDPDGYLKKGKLLPCHNALALELRNKFMASSILRAASSTTKPDLFIQITGNGHIPSTPGQYISDKSITDHITSINPEHIITVHTDLEKPARIIKHGDNQTIELSDFSLERYEEDYDGNKHEWKFIKSMLRQLGLNPALGNMQKMKPILKETLSL